MEFLTLFNRKEIDDHRAHLVLDALEVPRQAGDQTYTVCDRLEWIQEWCPVEWAKLHNAIQEVVHG